MREQTYRASAAARARELHDDRPRFSLDASVDGELAILAKLAGDVACGIDVLREKAFRRTQQQRLLLVDRALRTLSAGNRALVRCAEEAQLLAQMCRVIVEVGGYRVAWVGYAHHDARRSIFPMAQAGLVEGALERMNFSWADTPSGQSPAAMAIRTAKPHVRLDIATDPLLAPFRDKSLELGFAAVSAFPLLVDDEVIGNLDIVAGERDAFGDEELAVLTELAEDLSFGISGLRVRARHREAEKMLERMAFVDQLTGLPNRTRLRERLERAIEHARSERRSVALLTLNLDRFRDINEVLGFRSGDALLAQVAERLNGLLAAPALVARIGVDVFAVLVPGADAEQAVASARVLAEALDEPFEVEGARVEVQASIGIALFPGHGVDADALIMRSDAAAFQAKRDHQGIAVYRADSERENRERLMLMGKRPPELSNTHNPDADFHPEDNVVQLGQASANDGISWGRIVGTVKITAELCQAHEALGQRGFDAAVPRHQLIEDLHFQWCEHKLGHAIRRRAVHHRHPGDSPAQDTQGGDQVHEPFGRSQSRVFDLATGLEDMSHHPR